MDAEHWLMLGALMASMIFNTGGVKAQCNFEETWMERTWWTGYAEGESAVQGHPSYYFNMFSSKAVTTFQYPENLRAIEKWNCDQKETKEILSYNHHYYVVKNDESSSYECREYIALPPSVILWKRQTFGVARPDIETCLSILSWVKTVDVMVVYVNNLLAMSPCPWPEEQYSLSVHYLSEQLVEQRCPSTGQISSSKGSRVITNACDMTDSYQRPFSSQLYCVGSWSGRALNVTRSVNDAYVLLYRYEMKTSKYLLYVARYTTEHTGLIRMSIKTSPEERVTFDSTSSINLVDRRHSVFMFSPILPSSPGYTSYQNLLTTIGPYAERSLKTSLPSYTRRRSTLVFLPGMTARMNPKGTSQRNGLSDVLKGVTAPVVDSDGCPDMPCVNQGVCSISEGICLCPMGTTGLHCEIRIADPSMENQAPSISPSVGEKVPATPDKDEYDIASNSDDTFSSSNAPTGDNSTDNSEGNDKSKERHILISLLSLTGSFLLLSILLCPIACCRKPKTFPYEDKKEFVSEAPYDFDEGNLPQYTSSYNGKNVQAWFPNYKASRGHTQLGASVDDIDV